MIGVIPNPTKRIVVELPNSQVKSLISKIPSVYKKYRLDSTNPMFSQFTFSTLEFLSLGVFIDVNTTEISENKTELSIEVRRKMGAFDSWVEVQNANQHIQNILNSITYVSNGNTQEIKDDTGIEFSIGFIIGLVILFYILIQN
jgi:hypothetical protein